MRETRFGELTTRVVGGDDGDGGGEGPIVVLLHGFGAPGTDLIPLAQYLPATNDVRYVFPEAPLSLAMGLESRAWWMIDVAAMERAIMAGAMRDLTREVPDGLPDARAKMLGCLDAMWADLGGGPESTVLGGFSQGAMLSCDVTLRLDTSPLGLVLMSGTLLDEEGWTQRMPARAGMPVFQSHGAADPLLPFSIAEQLHEHLAEAGLEAQWAPFQGGHEIPPDVLGLLGTWLEARLLSAS